MNIKQQQQQQQQLHSLLNAAIGRKFKDAKFASCDQNFNSTVFVRVPKYHIKTNDHGDSRLQKVTLSLYSQEEKIRQ
jgi:hypothetical protein